MNSSFWVGVLSSLLASVIFAAATVFGVFRPIAHRLLKQIDRMVNPLVEFTDLEHLAVLISTACDFFHGDYTRLIVYRALPCELTLTLIDHVYGDSDAAVSAKPAIHHYDALINAIIQQGVGSFDETIFGRTGIPVIDAATLHAVKRHYILPDHPPLSTLIGFHDNLDEIGVLLIGKTESFKIGEVQEWLYGFLLIFSGDFKHIRGFMYKQNSHIKILERIFQQKKEDSEKRELLFSTAVVPIADLDRCATRFLDGHAA